jgi:hypothetical protein
MDVSTTTTKRTTPWNKGRLVGQKPPLKLRELWAIRMASCNHREPSNDPHHYRL